MNVRFTDEHQEMASIASRVIALVKTGTPASSGELNKLRLSLSKVVNAHCKEEAALMTGYETRLPLDIVRRYHDELLQWRRELIACNSSWPPAQVWEDRKGFLDVFSPLARALDQRVRWEEEKFYPALKQVLARAA